jgi:hypothetical protein
MFDSLDDIMRHDAAIEKSPRERLGEAIAIGLLSVLGFGGLFMAVRMLNG